MISPPPRSLGFDALWQSLTVPLAILSAIHFPTLESLLTQIITLGGDTDSNASMASQLLGAAHGLESLPHHRLTHLDQADQIQHTAHNFAQVLTNR